MVYADVNAVYSVYLLGSLMIAFGIAWMVYYMEYIKMKRYLKFTKQLDKYEDFKDKANVE